MAKKMRNRDKQQQAKPAARTPELQGSLRERAMVVRFATGRWYGRGADEEVIHDLRTKHNAKGDIGVFTKRLMRREVMAEIDGAVNDARRVHKKMTLPWSDGGSRLLPSDLYFDYRKLMTECEMRFHAAVEIFLRDFPKHLEVEKQRLNGLFRATDYPTLDGLRSRFYWKLLVEPIPSAEDFRVDLGEEEMKRVRQQLEEEVGSAMREASKEVWERMHSLIEKLKERLDSSDGAVRATLFDNIRDIVSMLPKLNVTSDPKLQAMGERIMKELVDGADVGAIRESASVRNDVSKKADKILDAMKSFLGE